jgi:hypothetical protein
MLQPASHDFSRQSLSLRHDQQEQEVQWPPHRALGTDPAQFLIMEIESELRFELAMQLTQYAGFRS